MPITVPDDDPVFEKGTCMPAKRSKTVFTCDGSMPFFLCLFLFLFVSFVLPGSVLFFFFCMFVSIVSLLFFAS